MVTIGYKKDKAGDYWMSIAIPHKAICDNHGHIC